MNIDNYSKTWIEMNVGTNLDISKYTHYTRYLGNISAHATTLEVGPGNGDFSYFLRKTYGLQAQHQYMIDLSSSIAKQLQSNTHFSGSTIVCDDTIHFLQTTNKKFDLIVLRHVLEHMERKYISDLIPLLIEKLHEHGKIVVEVPNMGNIPLGVYLMYGDFSHVTGFTEKSLAEAFIWNSGCDITMKTHNVLGKIIINKGVKKMIIDFLAKSIEVFSIIISFLSFRVFGSYYGLQRVYSSILLCVIQKK